MERRVTKRWMRLSVLLIAAISVVWVFGVPFSTISLATQGKGIKVVIKDRSGRKVGLYKGSYALVIGVSKYTAGWPNLESVPGEIDRIEGALKKQGFAVVKVLNPTSVQLRTAFENFINQYGFEEDNRLLFFFSGHGHTRKQGRKGYLVPADAPDPRSDDRGFVRKALGMGQILTWSRRIEAKHALFAFDSCFSGTVFKTKALPKHPPHISDITSHPVRQFISAGSAGEEVPARSVFVPSFIRALRGEGDLDEDGYVTGTEMGMYLHKKVLSYETGQTPQYGKIRDPDLDEGDFVFYLASSAATVYGPATTKAEATLSVKCNVSGAKVFLDNRNLGSTPLTDVAVSPGEHSIRVDKDAYEPYRKRIRLEAGRSITLQVSLSEERPTNGRLFVETEPEDARVRILNIGPKFYQGIELEPGRYHVGVSTSGHETKKQWVELGAGEDKYIDIRLEKLLVAEGVTPSDKSFTNSIGMTFVLIPAGTFMMGSPSNEQGRDNDERQHRVAISKPFYMQTTEVTQGQWYAMMGTRPWSGKKYVRDDPDCPAVYVSWNECQEFIRKTNQKEGGNKYRLPTEAQWEYACRAGSTTRFCFGDSDSVLAEYAWYDDNADAVGQDYAHRISTKKANAWSLYDMHGNVWEWCLDWYGDYPSGHVTDPTGPSSGSYRVYRGGGWYGRASYCRSARRGFSSPGRRGERLGFRLARTR